MLSFDGKINSFVLGYHLLLLLHEHALSASENVRNKRALTIGITQHLASSVTRLDLTKKENMLLFV